MKKLIINLAVAGFMTASVLGITNFALAQAGLPAAAGESVDSAISAEESVSAAELGVENPGILPTNPFYFFKELGRTIQRVLTFNPVNRANLELEIANTKLAEFKKVEEVSADDEAAILDALENYQAAQERLRARLEALKETTKNPEVERLLSQLAERTVKHEKVFDEVVTRFEDSKEIKDLAEIMKNKIAESVAAAAKNDDPAGLVAKFEQVLLEGKGGELKHVRSLEIIDRIQNEVAGDVREAFEKLRQDLGDRLEKDLTDVLNKEGIEGVGEAIEGLPGDYVRRSVILQEIRAQADRRVSDAIGKISSSFEVFIRSEADIAERAKEQIAKATEIIAEAKKVLAEKKDVTGVAASLIKEAEGHLREAGSALANGKAGEAFGQARSAEVLARNALRLLEEKSETNTKELEEDFSEFDLRIQKYAALLNDRGMTKENNPKAFALLEQAKQHLQFAREAFARKNFAEVNLHLGHVKGFIQNLARLIESSQRAVEQKILSPEIKPVQTEFVPLQRESVKMPIVPEPSTIIEPVETELVPLELEPIKPVFPEVKPVPTSFTEPAEPMIREFKLEANDSGFYPSPVLTVPKGSKVKITFIVRRENVYPAGLEIRSAKFKTGGLAPGQIGSVEFLADESFEFGSWWPASNVFKAGGKVVVQ